MLAFQLERILGADLKRQGLEKVALEMEFPLIYALTQMEKTGVIVDSKKLSDIGRQLKEETDRLEARIYAEAGRSFKIGSMQQVGKVLFGDLGLPVKQRTATGRPSTREEVLLDLSTEHALPGLIIDWRKVTKLQNTYIDGLQRMLHPRTGAGAYGLQPGGGCDRAIVLIPSGVAEYSVAACYGQGDTSCFCGTGGMVCAVCGLLAD